MKRIENRIGVREERIGEKLDIDAVTFDYFMTLVYPTHNKTEADFIDKILETLGEVIDINREEFLRIYSQRDMGYRRELDDTCHECLLDDLILDTLADLGCETGTIWNDIVKAVDEGLAMMEVVFYPDAIETLETLRERGYKLGLISNTHWRWNAERRGMMEPYFDVVTLSYEHGFAKPHASIFHTTLEKLRVEKDRCLHVGDNPTADIRGALGAGMKTAFVERYVSEVISDIRIEQLRELLPYL